MSIYCIWKSMSKSKNIRKKKAKQNSRLKNAENWLVNHQPRNLVKSYAKRYNISPEKAEKELIQLGWEDQIRIEEYEKEGIEWEYRYLGYTGEFVVAPVGADEWELYEFWNNISSLF